MSGRIMLGVFEAGFGPAIPLYFCERDNGTYVCNNYIHALSTSVLLHEGGDGSKSQCDILILINPFSSSNFV